MPLIDRTGCPGSLHGKHGTVSAYRYGCRCSDAREARRIYQKRQRERRLTPSLVNPTGTGRRVEALMALGWSGEKLGEFLGCSRRRAISWGRDSRAKVTARRARQVAALYERLSMTPGPSDRTRRRAKELGFAPPLAWEGRSIDDPKSRPLRGCFRSGRDKRPDDIAIGFACAGQVKLGALRPDERRLVIARLTDLGLTNRQVAARLSTSIRTVDRLKAKRAPREVA